MNVMFAMSHCREYTLAWECNLMALDSTLQKNKEALNG